MFSLKILIAVALIATALSLNSSIFAAAAAGTLLWSAAH